MIATQEELKTMLKSNKVNFEFIKNDRTIREANGTLSEKYIPENMRPKTDASIGRNITTLRYQDLDKNAWRSISGNTENVIVYTLIK